MSQFSIDLPDELAQRLEREARALNTTPSEHMITILNGAVAPAENLAPGNISQGLERLRVFLGRVPAITDIAISKDTEPYWWIKFQIDIDHKLAWHVVQEFGHILNYLSLEEPLPTVFMPVSPPPYLNGGPKDFLSWVIEAKLPFVDANYIADMLEGRLPQPVDDETKWLTDDDA